MSAAYHNTTHSTGVTLRTYEREAQSQQAAILAIYRARPGEALTPSQVWGLVNTRAPLTSIRRGITNLADAGLLVKTERQIEGPYGRPEHCWRYRRSEEQLELFA
jgi:predicted ArsR family transcriptional regulator